jgi:type II secretory pathway component GspD/PulD (secretin)
MAFLMKRSPTFFAALAALLITIPACFSSSRAEKSSEERIVVCMIQLEHAEAEELAAVLQPLLSPAGSIVPYRPTNTLIIKDRASVVEKLSTVIKGRPCMPISEQPSNDVGLEQKEFLLDR